MGLVLNLSYLLLTLPNFNSKSSQLPDGVVDKDLEYLDCDIFQFRGVNNVFFNVLRAQN